MAFNYSCCLAYVVQQSSAITGTYPDQQHARFSDETDLIFIKNRALKRIESLYNYFSVDIKL